jgi:hypothetical protein
MIVPYNNGMLSRFLISPRKRTPHSKEFPLDKTGRKDISHSCLSIPLTSSLTLTLILTLDALTFRLVIGLMVSFNDETQLNLPLLMTF